MLDKIFKDTLNEVTNLPTDKDEKAAAIMTKILTVCAWLKHSGADEEDVIKHMRISYRAVQNLREVENINRLVKQLDSLRM